jgi:integrase
MGIKQNPETMLWDAWYAKRPAKNTSAIRYAKTGIASEREAKRIEKELILKVCNKIAETKVPTWRTAVLQFLEECSMRGLSKQTITGYEYCLNAHTLERWGSRTIDSLTRSDVTELHQQAVGERTDGHQKYFLKCLRLVFQYAADRNYIPKSPVPMMKFKQKSKIKPVLTEEQVRKLLSRAREVNDEWYPHWTVALYTGMRNGELYALTWENVNLEDRSIYVTRAWDKMNGFKEYTKSGDDRVVSIAPELLLFLKEMKLKSNGDHFVLPRLPKWEKGDQARDLRRFLVGVGLPEMRFHDLRATWATMLLGKGVEAITVMQMGGWKDYETMMIYIRKAGINVRGGTDCLKLHNEKEIIAEVHELHSVHKS